MSHVTLNLSKEVILKMKNQYDDQLVSPPPGAIFRAKSAGTMITAYNSGKVLFQGSNSPTESAKWGSEKSVPQKKQNNFSSTSDHSYQPSDSLFTSNHIGSDESGTGDYFGPVTTCAVYVKQDQIELLKEMGIQDSKAITDDNIQLLAKGLMELEIPYSLLVLHNEKYNQMQQKGWTQGKMKAMLHYHVIENLLKKIDDAPFEGILVDQFCMPHVYIRHINSENKTLPDKSYFMTKAENYSIAVAAGSVIARASFLNEMDKLKEQIGYPLLKGASNKVDQLIAKIIRSEGEEVLPSIAKVHFANTNKARKL